MTCRSCRSSSPIFSVHKLSNYEGLLKQLVHATKFDASRDGAKTIGSLIAHNKTSSNIDYVTYVPTAANRIRYRGFDHALLMAAEVGRILQKSVIKTLIRKGKAQQFGANRIQRKKQMSGSFLAHNSELISGAKVLLVDDVISTGATVEESARILKAAGAKRIYVAVAAHNR